MSSIVYTRIPSSDPALVDEAARIGVADLHEALGPVAGRAALMGPAMKGLNAGQRIAGPAVTAFNYPGDNLMMHCALRLATAGQVLVTANGGLAQGAQWGDNAAINARHKGLAGVVVDGCIRDVDALREMRFPIWASAISAAHAEKRGPGSVNVPVVCCGALVEPGDIVVADGDGVLVVPHAQLAAAIERARAYQAKAAARLDRLKAGASLFELAGLQAAFDAAKVEQRDMIWSDDTTDRSRG